MDRITEITESVFNALSQIQRRDASAMTMPELVHQQLCTYIDQGSRLGSKLGLQSQDVEDIKYALCALCDEIVLSKGGALRDFWMPRLLQMRYFNENVAGEAFFERLAIIRRGLGDGAPALRGDATRSDVLRVYYLCLQFGFRGKYRVRGGEIELIDITDAVRNELIRVRQIPTELELSPHGQRKYEPLADARRNMLMVWLSVAAAVTSVLLYAALHLNLLDEASRLVERLSAPVK
jgi:type VI secretion system protein ImpK